MCEGEDNLAVDVFPTAREKDIAEFEETTDFDVKYHKSCSLFPHDVSDFEKNEVKLSMLMPCDLTF